MRESNRKILVKPKVFVPGYNRVGGIFGPDVNEIPVERAESLVR